MALLGRDLHPAAFPKYLSTLTHKACAVNRPQKNCMQMPDKSRTGQVAGRTEGFGRPRTARLFRGCSKVDRCRFALAVSIRVGLEAQGRLDNVLSRTVSDDKDKSSQGASI
jgi:hypothetical protein